MRRALRPDLSPVAPIAHQEEDIPRTVRKCAAEPAAADHLPEQAVVFLLTSPMGPNYLFLRKTPRLTSFSSPRFPNDLMGGWGGYGGFEERCTSARNRSRGGRNKGGGGKTA